ncbi:MAG: flagellar filament capping protein FliD [Planctomycetes bacterium]|nr:flagellar filament capping protein FliD [Planctomycetota bacterium]
MSSVGTLAITGLMSGIDTEALIAKLLELESRPLKLLESQKARAQTRSDVIGEIETLIRQVKTDVTSLRGETNVKKFTTSSTDTKIVTSTATGQAAEGAHSVVVNQLAAAAKMVHTAGTAAGTSTIGITFSEAVNSNLISSTTAAWFTVGTSDATYAFQFGAEGSFGVTFTAGSSYSIDSAANLINAASLAVGTYNAATVAYDSQTGQYYLDMTARMSTTQGVMSLTLSSGQAIDVFADTSDWYKVEATAGQFSYTYGSGSSAVTRSISLSESGTLEHLRDSINNDSGNPGVVASIIESGGTYHLSLTGRDSGETNTVVINNPATILSGFDSSDFTVTQVAQDAQVRVDGYPPATWTERSSNSISDIITGATINLQGTGTANITFTRDTTQLAEDLQTLVKSFNDLQTAVNYTTSFDPDTGETGILQGDSTILMALSQIRQSIIGIPAGFSVEDSYSMGAQIGVSFELDDSYQGFLMFDPTKFDAAVADDYDAVVKLVGAIGSGLSDSSRLIYDSAVSSTQAGIYDVQATFDTLGNVSMARIKLSTESDGAWRYMDISDGNMLTGKVDNPEQGLAIRAVYGGSALETAQVRLRNGIGDTTYSTIDDLLDVLTGPVAIDKMRYNTQVENLTDEIAVQEKRLETRKEILQKQYANLEATLAKLKDFQAQYQAMLAQIGSGG